MPAKTQQRKKLSDEVLCGDAEKVLGKLPDQLVHMIVTSPPYFQQRNYSAKTEVGQEATPQEYVQRLVAIFQECFRVLKDDGTLWMVLGDKYKDGAQLGMPWHGGWTMK